MHKTLKKVEKERLADMIQNIIKRMSKNKLVNVLVLKQKT